MKVFLLLENSILDNTIQFTRFCTYKVSFSLELKIDAKSLNRENKRFYLGCPLQANIKRIYFFSTLVFVHEHSRFTRQQGKGEAISLTPLYHFHPLHTHLGISWAITAESSPLHIASCQTWNREPLVYEWKSLTTKLSANKKNKNI